MKNRPRLGKYETGVPREWLRDAMRELNAFCRMKKLLNRLGLLSAFEQYAYRKKITK